MVIQIIFAILPLFVILSFFKWKVSWNEFFKLCLNMLFFLCLEMIYVVIIQVLVKNVEGLVPNLFWCTILFIFIKQLMYNAIPEETIKFLTIRQSNPQDRVAIIKNSLIASTFFMFFENYSYSSSQIIVGAYRMFIPIHMISQLVMAHFLIKANEQENKAKANKYVALSIFLPVIIHTLYNGGVRILEQSGLPNYIVPVCVVILGFITYISVLKTIRKNVSESKEVVESSGTHLPNYKAIIGVLYLVYWIYLYRI